MQFTLGKTLIHLRDALAWRLHAILGDRVVYGALLTSARIWRRTLRKPVFIGVTGSAGKTTTKEILLGMLSSRGKGIGNYSSYNNIEEIAKPMLRLRPTHTCFVAEVPGHQPNAMDKPLALLMPSIGIVTVIRDDHASASYPRAAIAREKSKLVASLPASGTAVLNADDPLVLAMAASSVAKVLTYGISPDADLRAEDINSVWPDRLQMTLVRGTERVKLRTQLCGSHWVPSVLGAIGGGLALGMTLEECVAGLANVPPFYGRMQPVSTPKGVTFIRDDYKAPLWTVDACFEFMKAAHAKRKIIVIGMLSDVGPDKGAKYAKVANLAREIAEVTIFVGPWASSVLKARKGNDDDTLRAFGHVHDAAQYINSIAREGDLVLLKGTNKTDHLFRIILARTNAIACWRDDCARESFCNECPERKKSSGLPMVPREVSRLAAAPELTPPRQRTIDPDEQVIVGLGNPEPSYAGTPHNIGHEVVDRIADSLGLTWEATPEAWIARGASQGRPVCLIKTRAAMNHTGTGLKQLAERMSFDSEQCILVHDDLDIPIGSIRNRSSGGAGGHRGVASILEAFQTDAFRRIKIGVGRTGAKLDRLQYVLTPFDAHDRNAVDAAIAAAHARALEMVERPSMVKPQ